MKFQCPLSTERTHQVSPEKQSTLALCHNYPRIYDDNMCCHRRCADICGHCSHIVPKTIRTSVPIAEQCTELSGQLKSIIQSTAPQMSTAPLDVSTGPDDLITLVLCGLRVFTPFFRKILNDRSQSQTSILSDCVNSTEPADRHLQIVAALLLQAAFLSISPSAPSPCQHQLLARALQSP